MLNAVKQCAEHNRGFDILIVIAEGYERKVRSFQSSCVFLRGEAIIEIRAEAIYAREEFNIVVGIAVFIRGVNGDKLGAFLCELLFSRVCTVFIGVKYVDFELIAL